MVTARFCRSTVSSIAALVADFDKVPASGTTPQEKHLLHRVVKEVRLLRSRMARLSAGVACAAEIATHGKVVTIADWLLPADGSFRRA